VGDANGVAGVDDAGREAVESGPDADEGREKDGTKAREIPKARVGDEQRVLGGGHGALGDFGRITR